ncbi:CPBP family intramembrane glutamic endopeptidase [Mucilaginibacter terrae]|uniref:Membrane protease YdiL (CAAX protease family) n=1 Tax=Mucilaginibacter terrae TaxID=1955052 RepID=A0ABU3GXS0_9SPHI|nr:CPBP family intramembrane glutamic endopeptidase [Mucilaginibacter terrae]MDT3404396.1 membrane protease YdiL (CAAX protease family) [Mucilaginibacter terrae]
MNTEKPYYNHNRAMSPAMQLVAFTGLTIGLLTLGTAIVFGYIYLRYGPAAVSQLASLNLASPVVLNNLWLLQVVGTTLPILFIPIVFGKLIMHEPEAYLRINTKFSALLILIVLATMAASMPFMESLITFNRKMVFPDSLKKLEKFVKESEASAQKVTAVLLKMNSWWDMIKALLLVGLATAIAEELMFRGCLQTILIRWQKNAHVGIWLTAILFSAFHMEFYGFLPRMALGVLFGYFTVWSGSIWPAVWAHFLNNGTAVVFAYIYGLNGDVKLDAKFDYILPLLSILFTVALLLGYRKVASRKTIAGSI